MAVPATAALRTLLAHAGEPHSEPLLFVLAGGIGAGVFAFHYEKEDLATLYLAGRHLWADDHAYLTAAARRLGWKTVTKESTGVKAAEQQLRAALERGAPVIAWVDAAHLPHRAMPAHYSGGGYHVITVHAIAGEAARIADEGEAPFDIPLRDLAAARGRIAKFRNRLLWLDGRAGRPPGASQVLADALKACTTALLKAKMANFRLDAFLELADRLTAAQGKESWAEMFPAGPKLWGALTSLHDCIEYYGTGGALGRHRFAAGLAEAGRHEAAAAYAAVAAEWSALAAAALPAEVPAFRQAGELLRRRSDLIAARGPVAEVRACWEALSRLQRDARKSFPLSPAQVVELRGALAGRLRRIHAAEVVALARLGG